MFAKALLLGSVAGLAAAQFPPPITGVKVVKSQFHEHVTISYKEVCPTPSLKHVDDPLTDISSPASVRLLPA